MKVRVARRAGFCWGVRRAVDSALETCARHGRRGPVQTLGPLIHNPQALDHLARRSVREVISAADVEDGAVVIRAHGIPLDDLHTLRKRSCDGHLRVVNATCPEVARVQSAIRRHASRGGFTIILGQPSHAEVVAHRSYATSGCAVVESLEGAKEIPDFDLMGALVVAQTTFSTSKFLEITTHLLGRNKGLRVKDTICRDTLLRQGEAKNLVAEVGGVIVVGGRSSNNTRHLFEVAERSGKPIQWVECAEDLDLTTLRGIAEVGVLAGASTPTWTVDEVVEALEQAGRSSQLRALVHTCWTLQLPLALGMGILTLLLHRILGWHSGWAGPLLPASFHLALCSLLPFGDPLGLDIKGQRHGRFLARHRGILISTGSLMGFIAIWAAARQGLWVMGGTLILAVLVFTYTWMQGMNRVNVLQGVPALKDLGQAGLPVLLAILLPWLQGQPAPQKDLAAAFTVFLCLMLAVHSLRHLRAFRENRILGREILAAAIGSSATRWVALGLLATGAGVFVWMGIQ